MNWDQLEGKLKQSTGKIREKWGKFTEDDLHVIAGNRDQLIGKIQERYGLAKEAAQKQADEFLKGLHEQDKAGVSATDRMNEETRHASH